SGASASEMSALRGLHPGTRPGVLARLERQGLLQRRIDAADRRRVRFRLTPAGRRIDRERKGTVEAAVRRAIGRAEPEMMAHTEAMIALLVAELARLD